MKPAPHPTAETQSFWDACAAGRLTVQSCGACGHHQFPPRALCVSCHSDQLAQTEIAGNGVVYSYTIVHRAPNRDFAADVPYILALIEFASGVRMMMNVIDCEPERVAIFMPVRVVFEQRGEAGPWLPQATQA